MGKILKILFIFNILIYLFFINYNVYAKSGNNNNIDFSKLTLEQKREYVRTKIRMINKRNLKKKNLLLRLKYKKLLIKKRNSLKLKRININSIVLNSAIENIKYNLDISYKLKYKSIQERALSCELSVTSDIISFFKKKKISETHIVNLVNKSYYNKKSEKIGKKTIWGNPNSGYVGYIDKLPNGNKARQNNNTGYGVLEKPIAKIFNKYGFNTKIITNKNYNAKYNQKNHLTEILTTLNYGNMVQLWGDYCTNPNFEDSNKKNKCKYWNSERKTSWYYKENGKLIKHEGLIGEHAFYLLGYKGGINNPSYIIVWDTLTGKHIYNIKEWLRKWNKMQNRSIIIYNNKQNNLLSNFYKNIENLFGHLTNYM